MANGEPGILLLASLMFSRTRARKLAAVLLAAGRKWKLYKDGWMEHHTAVRGCTEAHP